MKLSQKPQKNISWATSRKESKKAIWLSTTRGNQKHSNIKLNIKKTLSNKSRDKVWSKLRLKERLSHRSISRLSTGCNSNPINTSINHTNRTETC